jgi:YD repeat-containing protein
MRRKLAALLIAAILALPLGVAAQQGGTTFYVYDANGRLSVVIAPDGEAAVYQYDAAGNFTSITRITATTFQVYGFTPASGALGSQVTVFGSGFGSGATAVSFNGAAAQITSTTPNSVVAIVPNNATSGPITVTAPAGTGTTPTSFTVLSGVLVIPATASVLEGQNFQFSDIDTVPNDTGVTWSVNGVVGGSSAVGTITSSGLYTAPNQAPSPVTVAASSNTQPTLSGQAQVLIINPNDIVHPFAPAVSVQLGSFGAATIPVPASSVSVQVGPYVAGGQVTDYGAAVSVSTGPVVTSVAPDSLQLGTTALTVSGQNLAGATSIIFIGPSGVDSNVTASNIVANVDGTSVTATVVVSSSAVTGLHTVVIVAGSLSSLTSSNPTGSNTVQVTN